VVEYSEPNTWAIRPVAGLSLEIQRQRRKKFRREKEYPPFIKYRMGK
jgi:hypothetical protein